MEKEYLKEGFFMNKEKIQEMTTWLASNQAEVAYISNPSTIAYFSGFKSEPHERVLALFLSPDNDPFLFTPALEVEEAKNSGWPYDVIGYLDSEDPWKKICSELESRYHLKRLALEKNDLTVERFEALNGFLPGTDFSLDITPVIQKMQLTKTAAEIDTLLEAGNWADVAFEIGFSAVKEDISEMEIVAEIEYQLKKRGVSHMSFDTTVLAGANAASPHGVPGKQQIKPNELVLFDLGVIWNGYCSDATRTIAYHEPTELQRNIYDIVLEAELTAQAAVKPGITAGQLDEIARGVIESHGYGEYFNHRLGHGIGTTVHEFPSLITGNDLVIEEGMCFSIEPGIYIPEQVGVRIEDCIYVTETGCVPFTKTAKELLVLN